MPANKPDIILRHNFEKWCKLIEVSVPAENQPKTEIEIARMWGVKTETIPVIVGALGVIPHSIGGNLKKILKNLKEKIVMWDGQHSSNAAEPPICEHLFLRN